MDETGSFNEKKLREIGVNAYTAIEVFDFIVKLPTPLGEFVFKRIVEDAYSIASIQSLETIKPQLLRAVCDGIQTSQSVDPICKYLGINNLSDRKEVDRLVMESDELFAKLQSLYKYDHLPPIEDLVRSYSCFSIPVAGDDYENSWEDIRKRMLAINDIADNNDSLSSMEKSNCFIKLCYQTLFEKLASNNSSTQHDVLFYKWYCKGELIDTVFDTIYKCGVTSVSHALWENIVKKCEQNYYLAKIVQERFNYYRLFSPNIASCSFEYKGEKKLEATVVVASLPCIPISKDNRNQINDECMFELHKMLKLRGEIGCPYQVFLSAFSGRTQTTLPIKWLKGQKELASFLYVLQAKDKVDKEYAEMASKVFVQKNDKPCSAVTLKQPDFGTLRKEYIELFNSVGINR